MLRPHDMLCISIKKDKQLINLCLMKWNLWSELYLNFRKISKLNILFPDQRLELQKKLVNLILFYSPSILVLSQALMNHELFMPCLLAVYSSLFFSLIAKYLDEPQAWTASCLACAQYSPSLDILKHYWLTEDGFPLKMTYENGYSAYFVERLNDRIRLNRELLNWKPES